MAYAVGILWTLSLVALFAAALSDFSHRIIPNRLVAVTAGCGVALRLLADPRSIGLSLVIAVSLMLVLGLLAHQHMIGGGDAKLIAAVTLMLPHGRILGVLLMIAIGGGMLSGLYLLAHLVLRRYHTLGVTSEPSMAQGARPVSRIGALRTEVNKIASLRSIPYGLAVFAGLASYALTEAVRWFYATS